MRGAGGVRYPQGPSPAFLLWLYVLLSSKIVIVIVVGAPAQHHAHTGAGRRSPAPSADRGRRIQKPNVDAHAGADTQGTEINPHENGIVVIWFARIIAF